MALSLDRGERYGTVRVVFVGKNLLGLGVWQADALAIVNGYSRHAGNFPTFTRLFQAIVAGHERFDVLAAAGRPFDGCQRLLLGLPPEQQKQRKLLRPGG
jgi:hypothetical protein